MDRFVAMRTFVAVSRASTFAAAAAELAISPSLVSRHVSSLEEDLGVRLVHRTPRSVTITPEGTQYAEFAERILTEIDELEAELADRKTSAEGLLSIVSPKWIGMLDLPLAIGDFRKTHPGIRVRLELGGVSDRLHDFLDKGFDVAFHARHPGDSQVRVRRISDLPFLLAASPAYLERCGTPTTIAELDQHELLSHSNDPVWHFGENESASKLRVTAPAVSANAYLVIEQLVEQGCGIGYLPRGPATAALRSGRLVEVLPDLPPPSRSLYAVHAPGGRTPERVKIFLDFVTDWFRKPRQH